jgi:hypothetical protein
MHDDRRGHELAGVLGARPLDAAMRLWLGKRR